MNEIIMDAKKAVILLFIWVYGLIWTALDLFVVAERHETTAVNRHYWLIYISTFLKIPTKVPTIIFSKFGFSKQNLSYLL